MVDARLVSINRDAEALFQEDHQLQEAQRIEDAAFSSGVSSARGSRPGSRMSSWLM